MTDLEHNLGQAFTVRKDLESLSVVLSEAPNAGEQRMAIFNHVDQRANHAVIRIAGGEIVSCEQKNREGILYQHVNYGKILQSLGPELKKQIPQDWYPVVGSWLDGEQMPAETAKKD
jgi:hypothetical protein